MKVLFHKNFDKDYKKLKESERARCKERVVLFVNNQFDPLLNNHSLLGKYKGYRSINVGGDLRAIYKSQEDDMAVFVAIGTHSKLYR